MPSNKTVVAFRLNEDEERFVDEIATEMQIPRARVLALALRLLKKRLDDNTANSPDASTTDKVFQALR